MFSEELILSMLLGDGYISKEGRFNLDHSKKQFSYLNYKKTLLEKEFKVKLNPYFRKTHNTVAVYLDRKKIFLPIRNKIYKNGKKSIVEILKRIKDVDTLLFFWFSDDGVLNKSGIRLCVCDSSEEELKYMVNWFKRKIGITTYVKYDFHKDTNKSYPFLVFQEPETMNIWKRIRVKILKDSFLRKKFHAVHTKYESSYKNMEYKIPTSPRVLTIRDRSKINEDRIVSSYKKKTIKKIAKQFNVTEKIVRDILVDHKVLRKRGERI